MQNLTKSHKKRRLRSGEILGILVAMLVGTILSLSVLVSGIVTHLSG